MGARQSKRVEITAKKDVENGAIVGTEEKLEKIEEGETVASSKSNANGSTTTSSTVTAEQQETATSNTEVAAVPDLTPSKELESKSETMTEVAATEKLPSGEVISPSAADDSSKEEVKSPASPSEATTTTTEEGASTTEKKKKPKKRWSFRSFSFSKKDKQKPVASKDEQKQQETLPEGNEAVSQTEQQNNEDAEKKKKEQDEKKKDDQVPPPLPTSPPPTPAEEIAVVAPSIANVEVVAVPEKEESPNVSDGDLEANGAGEALADPIEEDEDKPLGESISSEPIPYTNGTSSLTNGTNGEIESNGEVTENGDLTSPVCELKTAAVAAVDSVTAKIDSLKLQIASDNSETPAQNGFGDHALNGEMNGTDVNGGTTCEMTSDSVVSVDVNADVSADN